MPFGVRGKSLLFFILSGAALFLLLIQLISTIVFPQDGPTAVRILAIAAALLSIGAFSWGFFFVSKLTNLLDVGEFNLNQALAEVRKLTQVIDTDFDGIVLTDVRGVIRHVNPKWISITGWTAEETEGRMTPAILKSGYQDAGFYTKFWLTIQSGNQFRGELINKRKDGGYYRVDEIVLPIKDDRGRVSGYAAFHHVLDADYKPSVKPPLEKPAYTEAS